MTKQKIGKKKLRGYVLNFNLLVTLPEDLPFHPCYWREAYADRKNGEIVVSGHHIQKYNMFSKVLLHEMVHLFGLNHCKDKGCLMYGKKVKDRAFELCYSCESKLKKKLENKFKKIRVIGA